MKRSSTVVGIVYFSLMVIAVTFPGVAPFNTIHPYVFGIPFTLLWDLMWVTGSLFVFYFLYRAHYE